MPKLAYTLVARIYPAIICSIPLYIFSFFYLQGLIPDFLSSMAHYQWVKGVTISVIFVYSMAQLVRLLGKVIEDHIFKHEREMPTTKMLLYGDTTFSEQQKDDLRHKIFKDFNIILPSSKTEQKNFSKVQQRIAEAVARIRNQTRESKLLLQHLTEYGFARNLVGGSIVGLFLSLINIFIFYVHENRVPLIISIFTIVFYTILLINGKKIIVWYGRRYAKVLFAEYISKGRNG